MSIFTQGVTFGQFAATAKKNGFDQAALVEVCKPWWEGNDPVTSFAKRVFLPMHKDVVIPYRTLLELYARWDAVQTEQKEKVCACGCGRPIKSKFKIFATTACRKKQSRTAKLPPKNNNEIS